MKENPGSGGSRTEAIKGERAERFQKTDVIEGGSEQCEDSHSAISLMDSADSEKHFS